MLRVEYSCTLHVLGNFGPEVSALWGLKHETFFDNILNIEIFTKIYIHRIRTAELISTRDSSLEAHCQGLAEKLVKLCFG